MVPRQFPIKHRPSQKRCIELEVSNESDEPKLCHAIGSQGVNRSSPVDVFKLTLHRINICCSQFAMETSGERI